VHLARTPDVLLQHVTRLPRTKAVRIHISTSLTRRHLGEGGALGTALNEIRGNHELTCPSPVHNEAAITVGVRPVGERRHNTVLGALEVTCLHDVRLGPELLAHTVPLHPPGLPPHARDVPVAQPVLDGALVFGGVQAAVGPDVRHPAYLVLVYVTHLETLSTFLQGTIIQQT